MYDVHYWPTPNGKKVTILLEELGLAYRVVVCNIMRGDQFEGDFLKISPNNRMPAIVDHDPPGGGAAAGRTWSVWWSVRLPTRRRSPATM